MPTQNIHVVTEVGTLEDAFEALAKFQKIMKYLINGNIDFENIRARSVKAENIEAGTITSEEIMANSITADRMDVDELSAITANLGHITAGLVEAVQIISSYISTSPTFPKAEMSNTNNLFGAYGTATRYVKIDSNPNALGAPMINLGFDGAETWLTQVGNALFVYGPGRDILITASRTRISGSINLAADADLKSYFVGAAADPDEAVDQLNTLIAVLRAMGILA